VLFAVVHVLMVVYAGPVNELRSMFSGRFRVRWPRAREAGDE
jgi:thiosulfate reductase cytochrome b subunit